MVEWQTSDGQALGPMWAQRGLRGWGKAQMLPEEPGAPREIPQGQPRKETLSRGDSGRAFKKT